LITIESFAITWPEKVLSIAKIGSEIRLFSTELRGEFNLE
jgi:hypothetical protein